MRIAIAHCQGRVSPVFDFSNDVYLIDIENGREVRRELRGLTSRDPFRRAREVMTLGADMLICGALSRQMEMALSGAGIRTAGFICGGMEDVLSAFLQGNLEDGRLLMPGCSARMPRRRFRNRAGKAESIFPEDQGRRRTTMPRGDGTGPPQGRSPGRGRMGGQSVGGNAGECICPNCGFKARHSVGQPCNQMECPRCRTRMTRG